MRAWLFIISAKYCGWPLKANAWLYPDIRDWDEDETGNYTIPAYIDFYINQQQLPSSDDIHNLVILLSKLLPIPGMGRWHLDLHLDDGYIRVIRQHIVIGSQPKPNSVQYHWYSTLEWEELEHARALAKRNGRARGKTDVSMSSVRSTIHRYT